MKNKRYACLLLIIFVSLISISAVSAAENNMAEIISNDANDEVVLEENIDDCLLVDEDNQYEILEDEIQYSPSKESDAEIDSLSINPISDNQKANTNANKLESSNDDMTKGNIVGKFSDIQKQINNAQPGDTIYLDAGIYTKDKHIKIYNKTNITIVGVKDSTVLDGLGKVIYEGQFTYPMIDIGYYSKNVTIKDIIFVNSYYPKGYGAALMVGCHNFVVSGCTFMNNTASEGAAIHFTNTMFNGTISNCTFVNNFINKSSYYSMGVVYLAGHDNHVSDCIFINNTDSTANGGLRCISIYSTHTYNNFISNCTFVDNKCGAIGSAEVNNVKSYNNSILGCTFINNSAGGTGAIVLNSDNDVIADCTFVNNTSINAHARAIGWSGDNLSVINCTFKIKAGKIIFSSSDDYSTLTFTIKANINYKSTIYNSKNKKPNYYNLTYWYDTPVDDSNYNQNIVIAGAGQYITLEVYDSNKKLVDNVTCLTDSKGQIKYDYTGLQHGNYTYKLYHLDNDEFLGFNRAGSFEYKYDFKLSADNLTMSYKDGSTWSVTLKDGSKPLSNAEVKFHVLDKVYTRVTNGKGVARLSINLNAGTYNISATFGSGAMILASVNATLVVNKVDALLSGDNLVMDYNDGSCLNVKFTDLNNSPIAGALIYVNNTLGVYKYRTDSEGVANVPVKLKVGEYDFIIGYDENNFNSANITKSVVVKKAKTVLVVENVSMGYKDGTKYTVTLTDLKGNAVSGVTVNVKNDDIVTYRYHTDDNGIAYAPVKWKPGEYVFTASFNGNSLYEASTDVSSNVIITEGVASLVVSDLNVYYKYGNLTATLTYGDGSPIVGAVIKFTQNGTTYKYRTDDNGVAVNPVKLRPGEYDYTISYDGNALMRPVNITPVIKVNKIDTIIAADDILMTFQDGTNYTARLTDIMDNPIAGFIVKVNNTVGVYKYKTDDEGVITFPINLRLGEYVFTAFIEGNDIYETASTKSSVIIKR